MMIGSRRRALDGDCSDGAGVKVIRSGVADDGGGAAGFAHGAEAAEKQGGPDALSAMAPEHASRTEEAAVARVVTGKADEGNTVIDRDLVGRRQGGKGEGDFGGPSFAEVRGDPAGEEAFFGRARTPYRDPAHVGIFSARIGFGVRVEFDEEIPHGGGRGGRGGRVRVAGFTRMLRRARREWVARPEREPDSPRPKHFRSVRGALVPESAEWLPSSRRDRCLRV